MRNLQMGLAGIPTVLCAVVALQGCVPSAPTGLEDRTQAEPTSPGEPEPPSEPEPEPPSAPEPPSQPEPPSTPEPPSDDPTTGDLRVTVRTEGDKSDPNGYMVHVGDGLVSERLDPDDSRVFPDLAPGDYKVELKDVAGYCEVEDEHPSTVEVAAGMEAEARFEIECDD